MIDQPFYIRNGAFVVFGGYVDFVHPFVGEEHFETAAGVVLEAFSGGERLIDVRELYCDR